LAAHRRALVVFDWNGCGAENKLAEVIESEVEEDLGRNGWQERCCIVLEPELETWIWSDSSCVDQELGWTRRRPNLRTWMLAENYIAARNEKPALPKEAFLAALREAGTPYSSPIFYSLAKSVSLNRCRDRAFLRLTSTLQRWFST